MSDIVSPPSTSRSRRLPTLSPSGTVEDPPSVRAGNSNQVSKKKKKRQPSGDVSTQRDETSRSPVQPGSTEELIKQKRKKKKTTVEQNEPQSQPEGLDSPQIKKKKKKPKPTSTIEADTYTQSEIGKTLAELYEDVVPLSESPRDVEKQEGWVTTGKALQSQVANKVYVETSKGTFIKRNAEHLAQTRQLEEKKKQKAKTSASTITTLDVALNSYTGFVIIARFLAGLLAGIGLWHIVISYEVYRRGVTEFLTNYSSFALPAASTFQFLFVFSCVFVMDRHDVLSMKAKDFTECFKFQSGALIIVLYFIGYIFSLSMYPLDDKINIYRYNATTEWSNPTQSQQSVESWLGLNVVRGLFAIFGWMVLSARPMINQLAVYLKNFKHDEFDIPRDKMDQDSVSEYSAQIGRSTTKLRQAAMA